MVTRDGGLGPAVAKIIAQGPAVAHGAALLFVQGKGIDVTSMAGLRCRSKVEYPHNLSTLSDEVQFECKHLPTATIERRIKPAAAASWAPYGE